MSDLETNDFGGSCLCGRVAYTFTQPPRVTVACHCAACRKATGSAFATWALVPKESFGFSRGQEHVGEFRSSEHGTRLFGKNCGTTLGNVTTKRPALMVVAAGTLDRVPPLLIAMHVRVASKASWFDITDGLPQHDTEPTKRG